jgi:hypothetical protein
MGHHESSMGFATTQLAGLDEESRNKVDVKDFRRWTGFGGSYIAKLI